MSASMPAQGLARFVGHGNDPDIFGALVGERIAAVFQLPSRTLDDHGNELWLVMESGVAFVYRTPNRAYWVASKADVDREVYHQRAALRNTIRKLGHLGTVAILAPEETP